MSNAAVYLGPLALFFAIAAAGAAWQGRHPRQEVDAREKLLAHDWQLPRWQNMPLWQRYRSHQDDPATYAAASARRARAFAAMALLIVLYLVSGVG